MSADTTATAATLTAPLGDTTASERSQAPDLGRMELERGLRFLHTLGMQSKIDLVDLSERVLALIETLIAAGVLDLRDFETRRQRTAEREAQRMNREGHVRVGLHDCADKYALCDLPEIDCESRLPICRARCCTMGFYLSVQDLDEGKVRWDYGAPYRIRQSTDGYCTHNHVDDRRCSVYANRPAVCRTYDCRKDERIWADYERRIPAAESSAQVSPP